MDLSQFRTDETSEEAGVWVEMGEGAKVRIARMYNRKYKQEFQKLMRPYRTQARTNTLPDDVAEELLIKVMAATILLDWKNIFLDGKEIPYSPANAEKMLTMFKDFRNIVSEYAQDMDLFRTAELEEAAKNSEVSSGGSSTGGKSNKS